MAAADKVLAVAKSYVDAKYKEGPNNDTKFGIWYGLNHQPWCAMFVSYVFNQAGYGKLVAASSSKGFASCQAGLDWFKAKGRVVATKDAKPGDIVFYQFDSDSAADHVGIVVENHIQHLELVTYEGNTAADHSGSQANGDGAYQKVRSYRVVKAVVRPQWPIISLPKPKKPAI